MLTKQYYSDSVYSDVIRPRIQPPIPEFYKTTDETFNDNLGKKKLFHFQFVILSSSCILYLNLNTI